MLKTLVVLFLLLLIPANGRATSAQQPAPTEFALLFTTGSAWDMSKQPAQQPHFAGHSANLRRLREGGILITGGRFGPYGLMIVRAPTQDSVMRLLAPDSTIAAGVFKVQVERWRTVYSGTLGTP